MERSAVYRRALAPIMLLLGVLGIAAAILGVMLEIRLQAFVIYWGCVGVTGLSGAFLIARRQAMKDEEAFWSAPTRRVSQALLPPIFVGAFAALPPLVAPQKPMLDLLIPLLPAAWMILYGCALTSAGFFMRRGMRVLGWVFIAAGTGLAVSAFVTQDSLNLQTRFGHWIMGASFGVLHLACAIYLRLGKDNGDLA